ncbi:MAG TPA: TspO/MBR family protein, partial [Pyrinomonadaceae bacterium]|nr:TspO/MBR family protein [Pyrinomonadaceae bacterium]
ATGTDRFRSVLVLAATIGVIVFNWLAATGRLGSDTAAISAKYPTLVTPAGYAFSIWSLIYVGLIAFSIYQMLPANLPRFRAVRSFYISSCALNCAWLYFWHRDQIAVCFVVIVALWATLGVICYQLRDPESLRDTWMAKAPFGLYFGWITAAMFVNLAIMLKFHNITFSPPVETTLAVILIVVAAACSVLVRVKLTNFFYPLAVAWALTAIAVKQSGHTAIVMVAAFAVIACLIASLSFVMNLRSSETR